MKAKVNNDTDYEVMGMDLAQGESFTNFWKPKCPVKVGDKFYKNYHVPNKLLIYEVIGIEEKQDENGTYYAITAHANNIAIGANTKVFSSRYLENGDYMIMKKGKK